MVDVFISYARRQRDRVEPLKARFEDMGLDVFFDLEGIDGGAVFPDVITRALDNSKAVLTCWSPVYFTRPWCLIEAREGMSRDILVPVTIEAFERTAPPADLRQVNYYDLTSWQGEDTHENWNRTLQRLGRLVGRDLAPQLKTGLFGGTRVAAPAPEPPPETEAKIDVLADLRETWANFPARENPDAVARFLARVAGAAPGSGLEFEVEHHLDELRRAAEAELKAQQEREAAERAKAEAAARELREWEDRLGPEAARAALAAKAGNPVAERVFPVRLEGVSGWPVPQMVAIPPGRFLMGSPSNEERWSGYDGREEPQHEVTIEYTFALGQYAVTFAEWDAAGARLERPGDQGWGRDRRPVIRVSWEDAQAYLGWLNERLGLDGKPDAYRLPSEAEWEYACRAGTTTPFSFGATITKAQAQFSEGKVGSAGSTVPVGSYPTNGFGLYDMHGNVWEWCADAWHETYEGAPADGSVWQGGDPSRRVLRGGSWNDVPQNLRSAGRGRNGPSGRFNNIGFRVARTL
ncbi:MAG: SUMF1/EgtB/PvdO family nonheme iron enzyme [Pseudomonadota bacterium]